MSLRVNSLGVNTQSSSDSATTLISNRALIDHNYEGIVTSAGAVTKWLNTANRNQAAYFNGTTAYISTPDSGSLALTGNVQTWTFYGVAASDFTPAAFQTLAGQWLSPNDRGWIATIDDTPAGFLQLFLSTTGTSGNSYNSTIAPTFVDGSLYDIQFTRNATTGAIEFFTAPTGSALIKLGATVSGPTGILFNSVANLVIGAYATGASSFTGYIRRFTLHDDDRLAASWDARDYTDYNATTMVSSGDGATYTLNGGAIIRDTFDMDVLLGTGGLRKHDSGALLLDGVAGSYVSAPDSPANSITGDITLIAYAALADWTPPTDDRTLIGKFVTTGSQRSYIFRVELTTGLLEVITSVDGATLVATVSSVAPSFIDGTGHWVRGTISLATDTATFYTSDDAPTTAYDAITWTQLGTVRPHVQTAIFDSTAAVTIGAWDVGTTDNISGQIYRACVIAGTDPTATPSVDFDPRLAGLTAGAGDTFFGAEMLKPSARVINLVDWAATGTGTVTNNGDGTVTIDDQDPVAGQYRINADTPAGDTDSHRTTITLSAGTALSTIVYTYYYNGTTIFHGIHIVWADPLNPTIYTGTSCSVTDNGNGTYTYVIDVTNNGTGNNTHRVQIRPTGAGADTTGTLIVHGEVSLQSEWTLNGGARIQNSGQAVVQTSGVGGIETTVAPPNIPTPMTMFMVGKADLLNNTLQYFTNARSTTTSAVEMVITAGNNHQINAGTALTVGAATTNLVLHTVRYNGDITSSYEVSGVGSITGTMGTEDYEFGTLFCSAGGASFLTGSMGRFLLFDEELSDAEVEFIQTLLLPN